MDTYNYEHACEIYFAAHTADPDDPMPAWLVEMNRQFAIINGRLMWRDHMPGGGLSEGYTRISREQFKTIFSNKRTNVRRPVTGKIRDITLDRAWLAHPNRKIGE